MQKLEGEFAEYYNSRQRRNGAFWGGRYHCTMVDGPEYIWNCMRYIDMNMVRARAVSSPEEWKWCGFNELTGVRKRYRMLDMAEVLTLHGCGSPEETPARSGRPPPPGVARHPSAANSRAGPRHP